MSWSSRLRICWCRRVALGGSQRAHVALLPGVATALALGLAAASSSGTVASVADTVQVVQSKLVKIHGAGGLRGLEAYQSGLLISADGHVLTALSYVLDSDPVTVTLGDGRRAEATLVGADPVLEIAVLKIGEAGLPYFQLARTAAVGRGTPVLVFSNLFGVAVGSEPLSVMHGWVAARTTLAARHGAYETPYQGPVYVLDAITSNPGVAGGALTTFEGDLLGMLGRELRHKENQTWLNYALPVEQIAAAVDDILAGQQRPLAAPPERTAVRPLRLSALGIELLPDVLPNTPPFVDTVQTGSPADASGLKPDDLIVYINRRFVRSCAELRGALQAIEHDQAVGLTVLRDQQLIDATLSAPVP
ncbi:MAG: hypothetical protein A2W31_13925 [Planctomycetes bacterium RBG_16_64_10]|nr:MAG: hypothetical protein A2W31_13925 [Planctomycetes bacterium RBG_16_64_10]